MARPIKETSVPKGKEAERFAGDVRVVTPESKDAAKKAIQTYKIATFQL